MCSDSVVLTRRAVRFFRIAPVILGLCGGSPAGASGQSFAPAEPGGARTAPHGGGWVTNFYHRVVRFAENARTDSLRVMMSNQPGADSALASLRGSVPSDGQRYWMATGRPLPQAHGLITLPPATPQGDYTYIWPASKADWPSGR